MKEVGFISLYPFILKRCSYSIAPCHSYHNWRPERLVVKLGRRATQQYCGQFSATYHLPIFMLSQGFTVILVTIQGPMVCFSR